MRTETARETGVRDQPDDGCRYADGRPFLQIRQCFLQSKRLQVLHWTATCELTCFSLWLTLAGSHFLGHAGNAGSAASFRDAS
jgi:hypothetical protein